MSSKNQRNTRLNGARAPKAKIASVDLFCGAGGLTRGLEAAGIDVVFGVDVDPDCEYPYQVNNKARFLLKTVEDLAISDLSQALSGAKFTLIAGCAPCQPFSTYSQGKAGPSDDRWHLLKHFSRIVTESRPDLVTMENVPRLAKERVFKDFVAALVNEGFHISHQIVNCTDYGVPQTRQRLVLLASRLGPIDMIGPTTRGGRPATVRKVIATLPPLKAGGACPTDPLHQASELSTLNFARIRASKPGGTWRDWESRLIAKCHKRSSGKTYPSIYGRMSWDEPAPTMTTQFYGFGNGRFGHPDQDRAISLREGALIQSFPRGYKFVPKGAPVYYKSIGRLIGNAVPVNLATAIGKSIVRHVMSYEKREKQAG
jgi:DNA (cytosine-5)-methyltransferase 1